MPVGMRLAADPKRAAVYAACAFALAGPFTLVGAVANGPSYRAEGGSIAPIVYAGVGAMLVAAVIPFLPWRRWGMHATLVFPALALAMLVASEIGSKSSRTVDGVMSTSTIVTLIFVWIGITQPRWSSVIFAPLAAAALCFAFAAEGAPLSVATTVVTVAIATIVGELIAFVKHRDAVHSDELGVVIDGTSGLRSETDPKAAARRLAATVAGLMRVPNVAVYLPDADGRFALAASEGSIPWEAERGERNLTGIAARSVPAGTELSIPLVGRSGQARGVVLATGRRRQDEFMLRLAQILGEQAGYQFDDLAQLDALNDETRRDALTGIGNRRYADEMLRELQAGDLIAVVDMDDLRGINARAGHHGGDEAIRAVARHLVDSVRAADRVARLGGDEFVVLFRDAGADAGELVERLTGSWNTARPDATFSVGATVYRGGDPEATLRIADDALFQAKRDGRARPYLVDSAPAENASGF